MLINSHLCMLYSISGSRLLPTSSATLKRTYCVLLHRRALFSMWTRRGSCQSQQWAPAAVCSDCCSQRCRTAHRVGFIRVSTLCQEQRASHSKTKKWQIPVRAKKKNKCFPLEMFGNLLFAIITVVITILNGYICPCEVFHYLHSLPAHHNAPQGHAFYALIRWNPL